MGVRGQHAAEEDSRVDRWPLVVDIVVGGSSIENR